MAWLLAVLPAVLGGTAGLMMVVSVARPVRQKDPHRRSGPFDTGDDPNAAGALIGPPLSRARSAARGVLLTAGILLIVPQGLVPIGFNLFGVDPRCGSGSPPATSPAAAGPGGGRLGRRRCARPLVGRPHRAPRETFLSVSR